MFDDISSVADAPCLLIRPMADEETSTVFHQCVHGPGPCATLGGVAGGCVHYCCHGEYDVKCVVMGRKFVLCFTNYVLC